MANQAIAPGAPSQSAKQVSTPAAAQVKLPEAFRQQSEPKTPEPEMDAFAELEQIDAKNPADYSRPPKKSESDKPGDKASEKPAAKPEAKSADKPAEKSPEKPKEEGKEQDAVGGEKKPDAELSADDPSKKFQLASELRRDYRRIHAESERMAARIKELESGKGAQPSEERKILDSKLETLEKRNKELEEEISYRDYTKSSEFQEKFKKPFETKLARVYRQVADLYVHAEDGTERPASREDFDRVLEAPQSDARRIAKEIFGEEDFREVLQYRRELNELQQNADEEMKSWREKAKEREVNQVSEQQKAREQAEVTFRKSIDTYVEKYPEWFGEIEGDEELNTALQKGFAVVDKSQDRNLPLDQRLDLLAATRLKAASFPRHIITIKRLKAKVAELEESLKAYEKSEPGEGQGQRSAGVGNNGDDGVSDVGDEIDAIERGNPVSR